MSSYWKTVKTLESGDYKVMFDWLMEDVTDVMCDATNKDYIRDKSRNRISLIEGNRAPSYVVTVPSSIGNFYYQAFKASEIEAKTTDVWITIMEALLLVVYAYHDNFDAYSDMYKDMYHCRPHMTEVEWQSIVARARSI